MSLPHGENGDETRQVTSAIGTAATPVSGGFTLYVLRLCRIGRVA
jgi:hypothetical protein